NLLVHLIPVSALDPTSTRDIAKEAVRLQSELAPMGANAWGARFNFDGVLVNGSSKSYVQVFRSGIIEAGEGQLFTYNQGIIPRIGIERSVWISVARYLQVQNKLGVSLPVFVIITLTGVKGFTLGLDQMFVFRHDVRSAAIDRNILYLPEIL